jgi:methylthioribose-1-phosphate isomerase
VALCERIANHGESLIATGAEIPIEERRPDEVRAGKSPEGCAVYNSAFDVTPVSLVTAHILDSGIVRLKNGGIF